MADSTISALPAASVVLSTDEVPIVSDPAGTPATQRATIAQVTAAAIATAETFASTGDASTLTSAKAYADAGDAATLASANSMAGALAGVAQSAAEAYADAGDATNASAITAEATTRASADTNEATARAAADATLTTNLATETTNRTSADTTLQTNITAEATARGAADTSEATSRVAGDAASVSTAASDATAKQLAAEATAVHELQLMAGYLAVSSTSFTRLGARAIDMSKYPTIAGYTRHVRLLVDVDKSTGATSGTVQLVDTTHSSTVVTGTSMTTTSNVNEEKDSGDLTVGASSGNIRNDVVSQYELQMKRTGGVDGTDAAYVTNARILIYYV